MSLCTILMLLAAACAGGAKPVAQAARKTTLQPASTARPSTLVAADLPALQVARALTETVNPAPSRTPTASATAAPTATATATQTPTATSTPTPAPAAAHLNGMNHQWQTYNNCGPASLAIVLGFFGQTVGQGQLNEQGFRAKTSPVRMASQFNRAEFGVQTQAYAIPPTREQTLGLIKYLLANNIPVVVLQRLNLEERISHYRVAEGYDEQAGVIIFDDPYYGPGYRLSYDDFMARFPNTFPPASFMPAYRPAQAELVEQLMAEWGATPR